MVDKYLSKFFPQEPIDTDEEEPPEMAYTIEYRQIAGVTVKYYKDATRNKPVWTIQECQKKLDKMIAENRPPEEFWNAVYQWQDKSDVDELTRDWAQDCIQQLEAIYVVMTIEPKATSTPSIQEAPTPKPPTKGLFTRPASSTKSPKGLFSRPAPAPPPPAKPSLFRKKQ